MARIALFTAATTNATSAAIEQIAPNTTMADEVSFQYFSPTAAWNSATLTIYISLDDGVTFTAITDGAFTADGAKTFKFTKDAQYRAAITDTASPISHSISLFCAGFIVLA